MRYGIVSIGDARILVGPNARYLFIREFYIDFFYVRETHFVRNFPRYDRSSRDINLRSNKLLYSDPLINKILNCHGDRNRYVCFFAINERLEQKREDVWIEICVRLRAIKGDKIRLIYLIQYQSS